MSWDRSRTGPQRRERAVNDSEAAGQIRGLMDEQARQDRATAQWLRDALDVVESSGLDLMITWDHTQHARVFELWDGTRLAATVAYRDAEWAVVEPYYGDDAEALGLPLTGDQ